jgi:galactosylceramidase
MFSIILINVVTVLSVLITLLITSAAAATYTVSKEGGLGRRFDGIGGLSAGSSTRLLADYNAVWYSQIMDYLFLPGFGASLQILKVEIGGDVQSTDGTEPSHMHSVDDENYERGYEWVLMVEAKRRNPNITLYGLSWGFPGWVGEGTEHPWTNSTVTYTVKWLLGAKNYYNLDIDYIGIWNEKSWNKDYTLALKAAITTVGLKTKIVGHDASWDVCDDLSKDSEWAAAIDVISAHYPGTEIKPNCCALNKVQWAGEDMSVDWATGAACWARALNQNYVRANLTATIAWALIASFYNNLKFAGTGMLRAVEPWSGFYEIGQVLWAAAHWGQFTESGWFFLQHGTGVGLLDNGGSYVALTDSTGQQLTIIVETMKRDSSQCAWSSSPFYNTTKQTATFQLDNSFAHITQLFVFFSDFNTYDVDQAFIYKGIVALNNGIFTLQLPVGVVYTVSTINGTKGTYEAPPSTPFPLPYEDDFDEYPVSSEAAFFSDQSGSWEIVETFSNRDRVMKQMVAEVPISWCSKEAPYPFSVLGNFQWQQPLSISVDVMIESVGTAFVAIGVSKGSCDVSGVGSPAIVFSINTTNNGLWMLTASTALTNPLSYGNVSVMSSTWYTLTLIVLTDHSEAYINGNLIGRCDLNVSSSSGLVAIGSSWNFVQFDNFRVQSPKQAIYTH